MKRWSDETKSLFAVIFNYGGPETSPKLPEVAILFRQLCQMTLL